MIITDAELFQLKIPFRLNFSHAKADRFFSDSLILKLTATDPDSASNVIYTGCGEAVIREYVSGSTGEGPESAFTSLLEPFRTENLAPETILERLQASEVPAPQLPLLCAVETALLDLLCTAGNTDIYDLLGRPPLRTEIVYGGTLPMLPASAAEKLLAGYKKAGITNLRVKIGSDTDYNEKILALVRRTMGEAFDLKVDANAGWNAAAAEANIPVLKRFGISIVEEPFGRGALEDGTVRRLIDSGAADGVVFMSDESALEPADLHRAAENGTFGMVNIRLSKNGGILRALEMAETAEGLGIRYMSGCHVGETGILSAAGRAAASLMKQPEYVDGSYDSHLLSGNITTEDLSFGRGGRAGIIRNRGIGYIIDSKKLEGWTIERIRCF